MKDTWFVVRFAAGHVYEVCASTALAAMILAQAEAIGNDEDFAVKTAKNLESDEVYKFTPAQACQTD